MHNFNFFFISSFFIFLISLVFFFDVGLPSPTPALELVPATSLVFVPLLQTTSDISPLEAALSSSWDLTQIYSILSSLLPLLPLVVETTPTSIVSSLMPATSSKPVGEEVEVMFVDELLQYAIKDFFSFLELCVNVILKGKSFVFIANFLNNYIISIESIGAEEKAVPYKAIMAQLQSNAKALSKTHSTDKSEIIEVTFRRLLEEQLRLRKEAQKKRCSMGSTQ